MVVCNAFRYAHFQPSMLGSYLYWISTAALVLCLFLSLMRRQTLRELAEARKKLLEEREQREQMRLELVHTRTASEKDLAAAKKQATDASAAREELEAAKTKHATERDALQTELEQARAALADRTNAEELAQKTIRELAEQVAAGQTGAAATEDKLSALSRELKNAQTEVSTLQKKLETDARLRKAAEDERNAAKASVAAIESKLREAEKATKALEATHAQALQAARVALEADLKAATDRVAQVEAELTAERSKVQTPAAPSGGGGGGDVLSALDADPYLNRGQKETIRMTYNQFTAKRRG